MEKSKELQKGFVHSQQFISTTDIINSMKERLSDVLQIIPVDFSDDSNSNIALIQKAV